MLLEIFIKGYVGLRFFSRWKWATREERL